MSETAPDRRSRRGGGRDARRQLRSNSATAAMPYIVRQLEPFDILSDESAEIIENNAEIILEEIGIDFRDDPEALTILRDVGCDVQGERVHFPRGLARQLCSTRRPAIPNMRVTRPEQLKLVVKIRSLHRYMDRLLSATSIMSAVMQPWKIFAIL